jgi:hypothetical protein
MFNLGGFVPKRFGQWSKDPVWAFVTFGIGYWFGEYIFLGHKLQVALNSPDPHRYLYSPQLEH